MRFIKEKLLFIGWVISDLLFPRQCENCMKVMDHKNRTYLCATCYQSIRWVSDYACSGCAGIFQGIESSEPWFCQSCKNEKRAYDSCVAVSLYEGCIKNLIQKFKFSKAEYLAHTLQFIFIKNIPKRIQEASADLILSVPLHPLKLKERGFNQSLYFAQIFSRNFWIPLLTKGLHRIKYSTGQTLQDKKSRIENIRDSFRVPHPEKIKGQKIILVDDVMTTGATVQECSKMLKNAGAKSITILVLARST